MSDEALVRLAEDAQAWLGTDLALPEFARSVRALVGEERYALLLRWSSRRGPKLSTEAFAEMQQLADTLKALVTCWQFIEAPKALRRAERQDGQ